MKNRTTIALVALFFGGLGLLWWADRSRMPDSRTRRELTGRVLPELADLPPSEVNRLEVAGPGGTAFAVVRKGEGWRIVAPIDAPADATLIDNLVTTLRTLVARPEAGELDGPPASFGLEPAKRTVRIFAAGENRPTATLELGNVVRDFRYVRDPARRGVQVVDAERVGLLDRSPDDWRQTRLFPVSLYDVAELRVRRGDATFGLRRAEGKWSLTAPIAAPAEDAQADAVVADVLALRAFGGASGFVREGTNDLARFGLDRPEIVIELTTLAAPNRPMTTLIGKPVPDDPLRRYAKWRDSDDIVKVEGRALAGLGRDPLAVRSKLVADVDADAVTHFEIKTPDRTYELVRTAEGWRTLKPHAGKADDRVVRDQLSWVAGIHAYDIAPRSRFSNTGLERPAAVLRVWQSDGPATGEKPAGEPRVVLSLGRAEPVKKALYAAKSGEPYVFVLSDTARVMIPRGAYAFADRTIARIPAGSIASLWLETDARTVKVADAQGVGKWTMTEPVRAPADAESIRRIESLLSTLRADRIVAMEGTEGPRDFGFAKPWRRLSWTLRDGKIGRLEIGGPDAEERGARFARTGDSATVFTLGAQALGVVDAELRERKIGGLDPAAVERLTIAGAKGTQVWRRRPQAFAGETWVLESGPQIPGAGQESLSATLQALSSLTALRFRQYVGATGLERPTLEITADLADGKTRRYRFGPVEQGGTIAVTTADGPNGAVALVPAASWATWLPTPSRAKPGELPRDPFAPK